MVGQHAECIFRSPSGMSYQTTSRFRADGAAETYEGVREGSAGGQVSGTDGSKVLVRILSENIYSQATAEAKANWEREVRLLRRLSAVYSGATSLPHVMTMVEEVFRMQKPVSCRVLVLSPKPESSLESRIRVSPRANEGMHGIWKQILRRHTMKSII
jgi:hypothetical protein